MHRNRSAGSWDPRWTTAQWQSAIISDKWFPCATTMWQFTTQNKLNRLLTRKRNTKRWTGVRHNDVVYFCFVKCIRSGPEGFLPLWLGAPSLSVLTLARIAHAFFRIVVGGCVYYVRKQKHPSFATITDEQTNKPHNCFYSGSIKQWRATVDTLSWTHSRRMYFIPCAFMKAVCLFSAATRNHIAARNKRIKFATIACACVHM